MKRIGIDVGGTNTDAVLIADEKVVHSVKRPTTEDVTSGILDALKALRTGLRRDTRTLEVTLAAPPGDGWGALTVRAVEGTTFGGWWRRDGRFLLTVAAEMGAPPPVALGDPGVLAAAEPRHSWLDRPLHL